MIVGTGIEVTSSSRRLRVLTYSAFSTLTAVSITLVGLLFVTFVIGRIMPLDPVLAIVGEQASKSTYDEAYQQLGLDRPVLVQFANYIWDVARGNLGSSLLTARPVAEDIMRVFPATVELASLSILIGAGFGIPLGVAAAARHGSWFDKCARLFALVGYSVPMFWLGLMGLLIFYGVLGWVGGPGRLDIVYMDIVPTVTGMILVDSLLDGNIAVFRNALSHIVLPASLLGYYSLAYISHLTRSFMLEQLSAEYIAGARIKGMPERVVIWRHAFRNIRVQLITVIALSYASLLEGSVLTETVFSWPGLGSYITRALFAADMNAVLGGTIVVGIIFTMLNLFSNRLYKTLDPRTR